jgi:GntP family gluconate:H+ symporter
MRPLGGAATEPHPPADRPLPGLLAAALPVVLPVVLIASHTVLQRLAKDAPPESLAASCATWAAVFGNANCALAAAATAALLVYVRQCRPTRTQTAKLVEQALESGAVIILITAAGGAFGAMLKEAQLGPAIEGWFGGAAEASGAGLLAAAFALCAVLKFSQGSSTVAMVTSSSMMASLLAPDSLPFHPVYLALAIGSGSLVGSWMNDSGFWIYCKLGGLTEVESLKSWTPMFALMGATGLGVTLALSALFPLRGLVAAAP